MGAYRDRSRHEGGRPLPPIRADEIPMVQAVFGFASYRATLERVERERYQERKRALLARRSTP